MPRILVNVSWGIWASMDLADTVSDMVTEFYLISTGKLARYWFFWFYLVLSSAFPEQKMGRKNVSANQNGEGGGKWEW